ncbi:hypothetical protein L1049_021650 [Liquidambar formosana]|uniref:Secreted protein n=1 Tax=Liquidambar formosana TaxID=63359 RepID=A0AAP0N7L1_LIQFO
MHIPFNSLVQINSVFMATLVLLLSELLRPQSASLTSLPPFSSPSSGAAAAGAAASVAASSSFTTKRVAQKSPRNETENGNEEEMVVDLQDLVWP